MKGKVVTASVALLFSLGASASAPKWTADQLEVIRFLESLPEAYATGDLSHYLDKYHKGYTNWYMTNDRIQDYAEVAAIIKRNQEAGVRIVDFRVTPITIEIEGDRAFVRYVEEELAPNDKGTEEWTRYHFAATLVRTDGTWQLWRTNFFRVSGEI